MIDGEFLWICNSFNVLVFDFSNYKASWKVTWVEAWAGKLSLTVTAYSSHLYNVVYSSLIPSTIIWSQTRSPSKAAGMFSGTQEKCSTCSKTVYPLEKVLYFRVHALFVGFCCHFSASHVSICWCSKTGERKSLFPLLPDQMKSRKAQNHECY